MSNLELTPTRFVAAIGSHPEYQLNRSKGIDLPHAVGRTAAFLANLETKESGYRTSEGATYHLISLIDPFVNAQGVLDHYRDLEHKGIKIDRDKKIPYLTKAIEFNHAAKELVNQNSSLRMSQVIQFVTQMYEVSHRAELGALSSQSRNAKLSEVNNSTRYLLNGMRNELGSEQIFEVLGLDYDEDTTIENELNGDDEIITMHGVKFGVDIKSSIRARDEARKKSPNPEKIIWSQLYPDDFGDSFRISRSVAEKRAPGMQQALYEAYLAS